jgi:hypothetical protein
LSSPNLKHIPFLPEVIESLKGLKGKLAFFYKIFPLTSKEVWSLSAHFGPELDRFQRKVDCDR